MTGCPPQGGSVARIYVPARGETPPPPAEIGGKGHHLAALLALQAEPRFEVPRFIVVRTAAFVALVAGDRPWPADAAAAEARAKEVRAMEIPASLLEEIRAALRSSGIEGMRLAVRSSAASEDSATKSFAGQFDTVLGVRFDPSDPEPLSGALRRVWASAFHAHAAAYEARGAADASGAASGGAPGTPMAVVIQEMADPFASGVAFSADPVSGDRATVVVSAVYGLGEGLVSGELDADTYRVRIAADRTVSVAATLAEKTHALRLASGSGPRLEPLSEALRTRAVLSDAQACRIASCARAIATAFGRPQDVEWGLVGEAPESLRLVVLQARPITTLAPEAPGPDAAGYPTQCGTAEPAPVGTAGPAGERRVWDNSNIIESYSGVTTPLTFSFARSVYEDVYRQFCRLMGTSEAMLDAHRQMFANMLGLIRGRVYYNLLNWYRMLALLPGFTWNRGFMERMMGVREALEAPPAPPSTGSRLRDLAAVARMLVRMLAGASALGREVPAFRARVERAIGPLSREDVSRWPAERALSLYRRLEGELLAHWRAPLVNDFFAMIFFGVLGRLTEKWLPQAPPTLVNDLLCGEGGIISTEPARRVMALARVVSGTPALRATFEDESDDARVLERLEREPAAAELLAELRAYLERFGDRCMEELKLETITLREDPRFLMTMIRAYVAAGTVDPAGAWERERAVRRAAEAVVAARLSTLRLAVYRWVLAGARMRVRDRENLRFERTRVFGVVRRIFLALGRHLAAAGALELPRDVFYLTREEVFAHFNGTAVTADLRALVAQRKAEFETYAREPAPPDRFETFGAPAERAACASPAAGAPGADTDELSGVGCCPGVVRAPVRVVRDPRRAGELGGCILVAERTDPGWTLLFPAVKGLLVQRGSLLSHSAIVAREVGLPCVVGVAGLLDALRDGDEVEMDGTSGRIRRLGRRT